MKAFILKNKKIICFVIVLLILLVAATFKMGCDLRHVLYFSAASEHESSYLKDFYANRNVVFFVPHEDDDYNLGGGILEQYVDAGSRVSVVYMTNGDAYGGGDLRINESALAMSRLGLKADDLIFLGYGDSWSDEEYDHIYNAPGDLELTSMGGFESTYGNETFTDFHTATYGQSAKYTRNNIKSDIKDVITQINPDVIYAIDCDEHPDHRALSLLFEECIGEIKADNMQYCPRIYKGFGYCTGWDGVRDFYSDNVEMTKYSTEDGTMLLRPQYMWEDRLRFPVAAKTLAFSEHSSTAYPVLDAFSSQDALHNFTCLVNSDKVFWERRSDSLLYDASISVSNDAEGKFLNDFKLSDIRNILKDPEDADWSEGVCHINSGDEAKFTLKEPAMIDRIVLYDSPYEDNDIIDGKIVFDDGSTIEVDDIRPNGSPTVIKFSEKKVGSFSFVVGKTEGEDPGLLEIEAYLGDLDSTNNSFIKLACDGNFMYDYYLNRGDEVELSVYTYPENIDAKIYIDGAEYKDAFFKYDGKEHEISAKTLDGTLYDQAYVHNLSPYLKMLVKIARIVETKKWIK